MNDRSEWGNKITEQDRENFRFTPTTLFDNVIWAEFSHRVDDKRSLQVDGYRCMGELLYKDEGGNKWYVYGWIKTDESI